MHPDPGSFLSFRTNSNSLIPNLERHSPKFRGSEQATCWLPSLLCLFYRFLIFIWLVKSCVQLRGTVEEKQKKESARQMNNSLVSRPVETCCQDSGCSVVKNNIGHLTYALMRSMRPPPPGPSSGPPTPPTPRFLSVPVPFVCLTHLQLCLS